MNLNGQEKGSVAQLERPQVAMNPSQKVFAIALQPVLSIFLAVKHTFTKKIIHWMPFGELFNEEFLINSTFLSKLNTVQINQKAFIESVCMLCWVLKRVI